MILIIQTDSKDDFINQLINYVNDFRNDVKSIALRMIIFTKNKNQQYYENQI